MLRHGGKLFAMAFCLTGCAASVPAIAPTNGALVHGHVQIDSSRRTAYFSLNNRNNHDLVCGPVHKRVVFDAPQNYLDVGETVLSEGEIYVSAGQTINSKVRAIDFPNLTGNGVEVQFATFGSSAINCRWADVGDYCDATFVDQVKSNTVGRLPDKILIEFNAKSCEEIAEKVESIRFWQGIDSLSSAQIQFLSKFFRYGVLVRS